MESASSGREQFMYRTGQLKAESNICWDLEFNGYHGLRSVNDIPNTRINKLCSQKLTKNQILRCYSLMNHIFPLIKDDTCFKLLTIIVLFDTSGIVSDDVASIDTVSVPSSSSSLSNVTTSVPSNVMESRGELVVSGSLSNESTTRDRIGCEMVAKKKPKTDDRFRDIKELQKYYVHLLKNHCKHLNNPKLRRLGDTEFSLNRTIYCCKQLSQYAKLLM